MIIFPQSSPALQITFIFVPHDSPFNSEIEDSRRVQRSDFRRFSFPLDQFILRHQFRQKLVVRSLVRLSSTTEPKTSGNFNNKIETMGLSLCFWSWCIFRSPVLVEDLEDRPELRIITPVFVDQVSRVAGYVLTRCHTELFEKHLLIRRQHEHCICPSATRNIQLQGRTFVFSVH